MTHRPVLRPRPRGLRSRAGFIILVVLLAACPAPPPSGPQPLNDFADLLTIYGNVENQHVLKDRPDLLAFLLSGALHGSKPLERMINRFLGDDTRYRTLVESPMELFVTVVHLQTGRVESAADV